MVRNSSGWMTGHVFQAHSKTALVHKLKVYCMSQDLLFHIQMVLDNALIDPYMLQGLHSDIKFVLLPQPKDQGVIHMFKTHYLQKTWRTLSLKCDVSLSELEKAAQAPVESEVELQKNVARRHCWEFTIRDAIWHVRDAWKEVMQSCICRAW